MAISAAHLAQFADFVILDSELTDEDREIQREDLEIFLEVIYEEAKPFAQDKYDAMIVDSDPLDYPWTTLRGANDEPAPAMVLILDRRDDLDPDPDPEFALWQRVADTLTEKIAQSLDKQLRNGWRPEEDVPLNPGYTEDKPTDTPTDKPPPKSSQPTKPPVIVEEVEVIKEIPTRDIRRERMTAAGAAVIGLAVGWLLFRREKT